jgi:hypothetical protein
MISKTYTIPVENIKSLRKKWWQFWRKKGDSAEEVLVDMMSKYTGEVKWKSFDRMNSINKIYKMEWE